VTQAAPAANVTSYGALPTAMVACTAPVAHEEFDDV
jgi:hypothetical protein